MAQHYATKLDILDGSLKMLMHASSGWQRPDGGMFIWMTAPAHVDDVTLLNRALDFGVAVLPGETFYANPADGRQLSTELCQSADRQARAWRPAAGRGACLFR